MIGANACTSCRRLDRETEPDPEDHEEDAWTCSSFPEGIPQKILDGDHAHRTPLGGEETWEPIPGWDEDFDLYVQVHTETTGEPPDGMPEEDPNRG